MADQKVWNKLQIWLHSLPNGLIHLIYISLSHSLYLYSKTKNIVVCQSLWSPYGARSLRSLRPSGGSKINSYLKNYQFFESISVGVIIWYFFFFFEKKNSWYADNIRLCAFLEDETSIFGNFTSFLTLSMFGYHGRTGILFGLISLIYITDKRNPGFDQHKENLFLSGYENPKFLSGYMMFAS